MLLRPVVYPTFFVDSDICCNIPCFKMAVNYKGVYASKYSNLCCLIMKPNPSIVRIIALGIYVTEKMVHWIALNSNEMDEIQQRNGIELEPSGIIIPVKLNWFHFDDEIIDRIKIIKRHFCII